MRVRWVTHSCSRAIEHSITMFSSEKLQHVLNRNAYSYPSFENNEKLKPPQLYGA